jgi:hypothetical protein
MKEKEILGEDKIIREMNEWKEESGKWRKEMSSYLKEIEKEGNPKSFECLALTGMDSLLKGMEKHGDLLIRIDDRTGFIKDIIYPISSKITYISAILSILTAFIIAVGIWIMTHGL